MHSPTTTNRRRPRLGRALLAAALAVCVLPASASAASVATIGITDDGTLAYRGNDRETNSLSIREFADAIEVTDNAGELKPTRPFNSFAQLCVPVTTRTVRCSHRPVRIRRISAFLNDRSDTAGPINTHLPVVIGGGSGDDTYNAGNPSFLTNVEFLGGRGVKDTVSYAGSATVGGQGVRITNDGLANDGRIGLDTDNVGRDVEVLIGSALRDEITANGPLNFAVTGEFARTFARGGQGDDVMRVGASGGLGVTILNGPVADGADKIIGGAASSHVDYSERTRPVNATLNFGGADDGEAGEGDEILGGNESLAGGQAGDILQAPALSRASHTISGNGGNDQLDGAEGADTLVGGPGGDTVRAFGGDDQVFVKDGELDTVSCGEGTDTFEVDSFDNFAQAAALCENGTIGVLRLAPKRLRARAGEPARLKLSWRHPRSWRQLRRVTLRLYRGDSRVGAVAISPRSRRIADRGGLTVLRRSRLVRKGKTVSAQLALRLHRSLAGQRLRIEIAAVDVRGARQLERRAGSIRVSR
jgi:hypothetical protein